MKKISLAIAAMMFAALAFVDGLVSDIHPFSGGFYSVVVTPPATTGGSATRTLEAISNSGTVLWKVAL